MMIRKVLVGLDWGFSEFNVPVRLGIARRVYQAKRGRNPLAERAADKLLSRDDCFYSSWQVTSGACLHNVAPGA